MKIKRYYILEHKGRTIDITRDMLTLGPMPVLWCNAGMYAIIPGAVLEELFESNGIVDERIPHAHSPRNLDKTLHVWWEQAYELEPDVGRLLCDKSYNQTDDSHK